MVGRAAIFSPVKDQICQSLAAFRSMTSMRSGCFIYVRWRMRRPETSAKRIPSREGNAPRVTFSRCELGEPANSLRLMDLNEKRSPQMKSFRHECAVAALLSACLAGTAQAQVHPYALANNYPTTAQTPSSHSMCQRIQPASPETRASPKVVRCSRRQWPTRPKVKGP